MGLIYGPSGCGKSSLVKAGLAPRLAEHVLPVYVEATADQTEAAADGGAREAFSRPCRRPRGCPRRWRACAAARACRPARSF